MFVVVRGFRGLCFGLSHVCVVCWHLANNLWQVVLLTWLQRKLSICQSVVTLVISSDGQIRIHQLSHLMEVQSAGRYSGLQNQLQTWWLTVQEFQRNAKDTN